MRTPRLGLALASLLVCLAWLAIAPAASAQHGSVWDESVLPTDARMIEAKTKLEQKSDWPRAVTLYREVLADDPGHAVARRWLARVQSWRGLHDDSLEHYARLLETAPEMPELAVERAEVLSWAGRYGEAEAAFEAILEKEPGDARAARGLAFVYLWSGQKGRADRAARRALALEDDAALRRELERLRAGTDPASIGQDSRLVNDSDGFAMWRLGSRAAMPLGLSQRVFVDAGLTQVSSDHGASLPVGEPARDRGFDWQVGLERQLARALQVEIGAGARHWRHAKTRARARGALEWTASDTTAVGLVVDHGDFLERSQSLGAVSKGITDTTTRGWLWQALHETATAYGYAETSFLSDANQRTAGGLALRLAPFEEADVSFSISTDVLHYARNATRYYDPSLDVSTGVGVRGAVSPAPWLTLHLEVGGGFGHTKQDGRTGRGLSYGVESGLRLAHRGWWLDASASRSQSQRLSRYVSHGFALSLGRGF